MGGSLSFRSFGVVRERVRCAEISWGFCCVYFGGCRVDIDVFVVSVVRGAVFYFIVFIDWVEDGVRVLVVFVVGGGLWRYRI